MRRLPFAWGRITVRIIMPDMIMVFLDLRRIVHTDTLITIRTLAHPMATGVRVTLYPASLLELAPGLDLADSEDSEGSTTAGSSGGGGLATEDLVGVALSIGALLELAPGLDLADSEDSESAKSKPGAN